MTVTDSSNVIDELQDLFYRSRYLAVVQRIEEIVADSGELPPAYGLIKANALFELHRVEESRDALRAVSRVGDGFDEEYLYTLARISSLDNKKEEALAIVEDIRTGTQDPRHRFKATLGKANILFSMREWGRIVPLIEELCDYEPLERPDERISLTHFLGSYYFYSNSSTELAKSYFNKALSAAAAETWSYFITRSLYQLAAVCESEKRHQELMWTLEMLRSFIDDSEQLYYAHMINSRFKAYFSINTPMEFDGDNSRILIKNKWIPFHDKPMLFKFLNLLHGKQAFVTKNSIAEDLWPHEDYKPRVHDPRIFDIAKRARNLIEAYENQPVVLLSGRMGYKLASM